MFLAENQAACREWKQLSVDKSVQLQLECSRGQEEGQPNKKNDPEASQRASYGRTTGQSVTGALLPDYQCKEHVLHRH